MRIRDFYFDHLANFITSGNLILQDRLSAVSIRPVFDRILTKAYVTKVWAIVALPVKFQSNLTDLVRQEMFLRCPFAKVQVLFHNTPVQVNVSSEVFKRQYADAIEKRDMYQQYFDSLKDNEKHAGKTERLPDGRKFTFTARDLERVVDRADSYTYVNNHTLSGGVFFRSHIFIQVSAETSSQMVSAKRELLSILSYDKILFKELSGSMAKYLTNFGPANLNQDDLSKFPSLLVSDENLSNLTSYQTHGLVGGDGILTGSDLLSKLPLYFNFFESTSAQVIVVAAKAGEGKTALSQMMGLEFLADNGKHVSALDLKGFEWDVLNEFHNILKISMAKRMVNTMRLDDLKIDNSSEAKIAFDTAIRDTISLFSLMVNLQDGEGNIVDLESILREAIQKVYNFHNIVPTNASTFAKTKLIKLSEVLIFVESLKNSPSYAQHHKLCQTVILRCDEYFSPESSQSEAFVNEVSLSEVINSPFVVFSFDKNQNTILDTLDRIKVHMVSVLNAKKSWARRKEGKHTIEIYEEGARAEDTGEIGKGSLLNVISHRATGSRSNNVTIMLLTNTLSMFDNPQAKPIKSNITTMIVGKLDQYDIDYIRDKFQGFTDIIPYVEKISFDGDNNLKNAFAIKVDTGKTVDKALLKFLIPDSIERRIRSRNVDVFRKTSS